MEFLNDFEINSAKLHWQVQTCAVILWIAVVYCSVWSINTQPFNRKERLLWTVVVVAIPLGGLLAYLIRAGHTASTGALSFWKKPKKKKKFYGY
ncbi:MAG: PLDc N-terminal domain-containing protein [Limisphaerales bacterium]